MVNSRAKGHNTERRAKKELESIGWLVDKARGSMRWSKNNDFFNMWDLIAIRGGILRFIQVKTNNKPKLDKFINWRNKWVGAYSDCIICEIWIYYEKNKAKKWKGWRKIVI